MATLVEECGCTAIMLDDVVPQNKMYKGDYIYKNWINFSVCEDHEKDPEERERAYYVLQPTKVYIDDL